MQMIRASNGWAMKSMCAAALAAMLLGGCATVSTTGTTTSQQSRNATIALAGAPN